VLRAICPASLAPRSAPEKACGPHIENYTNDHGALDGAAKLDQLGEWDAAILLYEGVAEKWPANGSYARECAKVIRARQEQSR
jgi:hypothetical protein